MTRPVHRNRNTEIDFRGETRSNATHASTTDPDARLFKKSAGTGAVLCFMGEEDQKTVQWTVFADARLMDEAGSAIGPRNPPQGNGLIVQADLTQADGHAERRAAIDPRHGPRTSGGAMARSTAIRPDRPDA